MIELLAVLFLFISVVLRQLNREDKFDKPTYATIKELDMEQRVQQYVLEKMWAEQITKIREVMIIVICAYVLADPVIGFFSQYIN